MKKKEILKKKRYEVVILAKEEPLYEDLNVLHEFELDSDKDFSCFLCEREKYDDNNNIYWEVKIKMDELEALLSNKGSGTSFTSFYINGALDRYSMEFMKYFVKQI